MTGLWILVGTVGLLGFALWWPLVNWPSGKSLEARESLGSTLMTGAVIGVAFFFVNHATTQNEKKIADAQAQEREHAAQVLADASQRFAKEQEVRLTVGLQHDLSGADLSNKNLSGVDFSGKNLEGADLRGAALHGANLVGANLRNARLDDAQLDPSKPYPAADLSRDRMEGAVLSGARLQRVKLEGTQLEGAIFGRSKGGKSADLEYALLVNADLRGACLAGANLRHAHISGVDFTGADLTGADLRSAQLELDGVPTYLRHAWVHGIQLEPARRVYLARDHTAARPAPQSSDPPAPAHADRVVRVWDGDTIEFHDLGWVRLIGVDAPRRNEPIGATARAFVQRLLPAGREVRYAVVSKERRELVPRHVGRALAYVWLRDGRLLNRLLLTRGMAARETKHLEAPRYTPLLDRQQRVAKSFGRGVWSVCPAK
jgi:uncharacterized protein YjbI with pentapeptide repeats/endonuclease YncB( thermonuclease family)